MGREIKFRAWDSSIKRMDYNPSMDFYPEMGTEINGIFLYPRDYTFMQYTGLKDKNGKEIYESDYLGDLCVYWGSGKYILQNISTGDIIDCNQITTYDKEITGNKYEAPREHKAMETDL